MDGTDDPVGKTPALELAAIAFAVNLAWEYAHWPLYECAPRRPCCRAPLTLAAAVLDAALILGIYALGARAFRDRYWIRNLDRPKILFSAATGALIGTAIEEAALSRR